MHVPDVVAEQPQVARRCDRDAITRAPDQSERPAALPRPACGHDLVERDLAARPHHLVDAGHLDLQRHLGLDAATEVWPLDTRALGRYVDEQGAPLAVADDLPAQSFDIDARTDSTEMIAHEENFRPPRV